MLFDHKESIDNGERQTFFWHDPSQSIGDIQNQLEGLHSGRVSRLAVTTDLVRCHKLGEASFSKSPNCLQFDH